MPTNFAPSSDARPADCIRWKREIRNQFLRPVSELRKLTSRRFPNLDRLLPTARLGIDVIPRIRTNPHRVAIIRRMLDLDIFDFEAYWQESAEARASGLNPLLHYLRHDWPRGIVPSASPYAKEFLDATFPVEQPSRQTRAASSRHPAAARTRPPLNEVNPLVSIAIVNLNGARHLPELFASLATQTYPSFEIIFIDNASADDSVKLVQQLCPAARILRLQRNVGFAEANNLAMDLARGRLLCLLNNDTRVDPDWLAALVRAWRAAPDVAAVCSKVRFWCPFVSIHLKVDQPDTLVRIARESLVTFHPDYAKLIILTPHQETIIDGETWIKFAGELRLLLPCEHNGELVLRVHTEQARSLAVQIGQSPTTTHDLAGGESLRSFVIDPNHVKPAWLLNNTGSTIDASLLETADRGINEFDDGQFDSPVDVGAVCGCSLLVDTACLEGLPLFAAAFFAYYEDTELSVRLRKAGWKLRYAPDSIVFHRHASSLGENSPQFRHLTTRNRLWLLLLHGEPGLAKRELAASLAGLSHLEATQALNRPDVPRLKQELTDFQAEIIANRAYARTERLPRIGIYNAYWSTAGGGEYNALMFAVYFATLGSVDLIGEADFNLDALARGFDLQLKHCRKRIIPFVDTAITSGYDIFINTTFCSTLTSAAVHSYYLVMFPQRLNLPSGERKAFLQSYRFLANSNYTRDWTHKYWGITPTVIYPSIQAQSLTRSAIPKTKTILHVGRFFRGGHNKKQAELAAVFSKLKRSGQLGPEWRLVLAGRLHPQDRDYAEAIITQYADDGVQVLTDLDRTTLDSLYAEALLYWHATGLNENPQEQPEKFEHFGITTCESMAAGCIVIAYHIGGPGEVIKHGYNGYLFADVAALADLTMQVAQAWECSDPSIAAMQQAARNRSADFSREAFLQNLRAIHPIELAAPKLL